MEWELASLIPLGGSLQQKPAAPFGRSRVFFLYHRIQASLMLA
jgi:hypothetical protein